MSPSSSSGTAFGSGIRQALRYGAVGVVSNVMLYLAYLALTGAGAGHKAAMSVVYAVGVAMTFFANGRWTFSSRELGAAVFARYVLAYAMGYCLNLALLWALVDRAGFPHRPVQGGLILVVAAFLFLLHKFWVFARPSQSPTR